VIAMNGRSQEPSRSHLLELVICSVLVLLSLWGVVRYEASGLVKGDIDGIVLLAICLLIGCTLSVQLVWIAPCAGWLNSLQRNRTAQAVAPDHGEARQSWLAKWQGEQNRRSGKASIIAEVTDVRTNERTHSMAH
jgi:hypothetical protein